MALGLVEFVGATEAKVGRASRAQHLCQTARVNGIPFDQKYLDLVAGHGTPRLSLSSAFSMHVQPERAFSGTRNEGCSCRPSETRRAKAIVAFAYNGSRVTACDAVDV